MQQLRPSTIREILKVTAQPEIISFAGGLPAPELFPVEAISRAAQQVLAGDGPSALQYGPSEGYQPLRESIATVMSLPGEAPPAAARAASAAAEAASASEEREAKARAWTGAMAFTQLRKPTRPRRRTTT